MKATKNTNHRLLIGSAKWYYQRYALTTEHVDEEIRLVMAGQRGSLRRLIHLQGLQAAACQRLHEYLQQIAVRVRRDDTDGKEFREYLDTEAQKIARAGSKK